MPSILRTVALLGAAVAGVALASDTTLHKIDGATCGQCDIDSKYAPYAEKFTSLEAGTCASVGYTVANGTTTESVPILGDLTVYLFLKPSDDGISDKLEIKSLRG
jgi:hypothetical protein